MTSDITAHQKILVTFFLMAEKRAIRTLFCQDLCREQGLFGECGDMSCHRGKVPRGDGDRVVAFRFLRDQLAVA
jgi:hypothetical protein